MRKEVVLAIFLGLILGGIITFGFYQANKSVTSTSADLTPTPTQSSNSDSINSTLLTVTSPDDGDILSSDTTTITGRVSDPDSVIIITTDEDYFTTKPNADNSFTQDIDLVGGSNLIQITAISASGKRQDSYLNLVYSTKFDAE